jgi:hypothetical protein
MCLLYPREVQLCVRDLVPEAMPIINARTVDCIELLVVALLNLLCVVLRCPVLPRGVACWD